MTGDEAKSGQATGTSGPGVTEQDFVALAPGKTIGRYEILSILGQGGFGITYRARDTQLDRDVAIKEYLPSALAIRQDGTTVLPRSTKVAEDFSWGRQRFVDEGRTLATLQRAPAIVRVFDFLEANGTAYIVMELVPGDTLENRLRAGPLTPAEVDRILWPLLDGLERVHETGFLHRDIKPANILLDGEGRPTLIDFGASRMAVAGRTSAMTAIFTPGYAAAEQMTSAKQGPWTDIYGLSATLYHAITGTAPPSSFDRALDDEYAALGRSMPAGFAPGLLVGIDAGLALRASDRPQSIAGWRPILGQTGAPDAQATVALRRPADSDATVFVRQPTLSPPSVSPPSISPPAAPSAPPAKGGKGLWMALAAVVVLALGGGGYWYATRPPAVDLAAVQKVEALQREQLAAQQAQKAQATELAKLREEKAAREKAAHDLAERQKIEEELRGKLAAEQAAKEKAEAETRAKTEAGKTQAMDAETALRLTPLDRQRAQVALTALGFRNSTGADGVFGPRMREVIAAWQKSRSYPDTGYLTGAENQELLRTASAAVTRFDDDQKKADEAKKKADEDKARAAAAAPALTPAPPPSGAQTGIDGRWTGTYQCTPSRGGGPFTMHVVLVIQGGTGTWSVPNATETTLGNHSIAVRLTGASVVVQRTYSPTSGANKGSLATSMIVAHFEGGTISGSGPESNSGGRICTIALTR